MNIHSSECFVVILSRNQDENGVISTTNVDDDFLKMPVHSVSETDSAVTAAASSSSVSHITSGKFQNFTYVSKSHQVPMYAAAAEYGAIAVCFLLSFCPLFHFLFHTGCLSEAAILCIVITHFFLCLDFSFSIFFGLVVIVNHCAIVYAAIG